MKCRLLKMLLTGLLVLTIVMSCLFGAVAESLQAASPYATAMLKQLETMREDSLAYPDLYEDERLIRDTVTYLFQLKADMIENGYSESSFAPFLAPSAERRETTEYFIDSIGTYRQQISSYRMEILWGNLELEFNDITIDGTSATANIYESYSCVFSDSADQITAMGSDCEVTLNKVNGIWYIDSVLTDFARARAVLGYVEEEVVQEYPQLSSAAEEAERAGFTHQSYSSVNSTAYARSYVSSSNGLFPDFTGNGGDCQNFASQAIWRGLGGTNTQAAVTNRWMPMITPATSSTRAWYCNHNNHNASWTGTISFGNYINGGGAATYGPYGQIISGYASAQAGDILQMDHDRDGTWDHSFVVTLVRGTAGNRAASDIQVCEHSPSFGAGWLTSSSSYVSSGAYRIIRIGGGWYR